MNNKNNPIVQERWYKTFLGERQQHTYWLYKVIDDILDMRNGNKQIRKFVEIGTGTGCVSVILALHAKQRGGAFLTYDVKPELSVPMTPLFQALGVLNLHKDHWTDLASIRMHMDEEPTFFFCDGGNKADEFNFYADYLPSGSVIAAHDYTVEIFPEDISATVSKLSLEPLQQEDWTGGKDDIQTCFYRKP
jgi:predicted O-methyltransferase YrrM